MVVPHPPRPAGLLLTGGASTRMGRDKATIEFGGETIAARVARAMAAVADPLLVVGGEAGTGLPAVDDPREGPLVAVAFGREKLLERGSDVPAIVVACDVPRVTPALLRLLFDELARTGADAVVPLLGGADQSLCACYGPTALDRARRLRDSGERSMRSLLAAELTIRRLTEDEWSAVAGDRRALADVDVPSDLDALNGPPSG